MFLILFTIYVKHFVPLYTSSCISGAGDNIYVLSRWGIGHLVGGRYEEGFPFSSDFRKVDLIFYEEGRGLWLIRGDSLFLFNPVIKAEVLKGVIKRKPTSISVNRGKVYLEVKDKVYLFNLDSQTLVPSSCIDCVWSGKLSLKILKKEGIPDFVIDPDAERYRVTSVYTDYENAWVTTSGYGILRYSIFNRIPDTLHYGAYNVKHIAGYKDYIIFLGEKDIFTFKNGMWRRYRDPALLPYELSSLFVDMKRVKVRNGEIVRGEGEPFYVKGTNFILKEGGVYIEKGNETKFLRGIKRIFTDNSRVVLLGENDVYLWEEGPVGFNFPFMTHEIEDIFIAGDDYVFATRRGILKMRPGELLRKYDRKDGLPDSLIFSVYVEGERIWYASPSGVGFIEE